MSVNNSLQRKIKARKSPIVINEEVLSLIKNNHDKAIYLELLKEETQSISDISIEVNLSERRVYQGIKNLEKIGIIIFNRKEIIILK